MIIPEQKVMDLDYGPKDLLQLDLSYRNSSLRSIGSQRELEHYINSELRAKNKSYAIGGYGEDRRIYQRFEHFDTQESKRTIHLGLDFWAPAGSGINAPMDGRVHSWAFNNNPGDYGATLILEHSYQSRTLYSLYGHLALAELEGLTEGKRLKAGECIARLGDYPENGGWPPHLHFQLIYDMEDFKGDYPGVVEPHQAEAYLKNCPNPEKFF